MPGFWRGRRAGQAWERESARTRRAVARRSTEKRVCATDGVAAIVREFSRYVHRRDGIRTSQAIKVGAPVDFFLAHSSVGIFRG